MRFWKLLILWFGLTLASLYAYHGHLRDARHYDFEIHRALYQEFYQIRRQPAYAALSQAVFSAKRYLEDRDSLLKAESLSPLTMSLCDEALEGQRKSRWLLSVFTWLTLLLALIGVLAWLRLLIRGVVGFIRLRRDEKSAGLKNLAVMTAALFLLLAASRWMTAGVSRPVLEKLDYRQSMAGALKMDQYYENVFEGWIELTNQLFIFYHKEQGPENKLMRIRQIEEAARVFESHLKSLEPVQSEWLGFDSSRLTEPALQELGRFMEALAVLRQWAAEAEGAQNEKLIEVWNRFAQGFAEYLEGLFDGHQAIATETTRSFFVEDARREYQRMQVREDLSRDILIVPGFEIYKRMGFLGKPE